MLIEVKLPGESSRPEARGSAANSGSAQLSVSMPPSVQFEFNMFKNFASAIKRILRSTCLVKLPGEKCLA